MVEISTDNLPKM